MHSALAVLVFALHYSSITAALYLPQFRLSSSAPSLGHASGVQNKCTFTVWHKQVCRASVKSNYIQMNELVDHPNGIVIDIASYRAPTARNSYSKISDAQVFTIEGLLDDRNLTLRAKDGSDVVTFEYDGFKGSSDGSQESQTAYCHTGAWNVNSWDCSAGSRERRLDCAFLCEAIVEEESGDASGIEL